MEKDQVWKIAGAAGGVIVGILALKYIFSESDEARIHRELNKDMNNLGNVSKDSSGTIKVQDFIELFKIITKFSKQKIRNIKRANASKRRDNINNDEKYKELVTSQINEEEQIYQDIATQVMENFNIEENDFLMAQQIHMANPLFQ
jgi:hypothetical protein